MTTSVSGHSPGTDEWKRSLGSVKLRGFISLNIEQNATNFRFLNTTIINILAYVILFYVLSVYYAKYTAKLWGSSNIFSHVSAFAEQWPERENAY